jgi:glycosyltransferase involved in cell wall biosynthesis
MPSGVDVKVSVVIPCLNEAAAIGHCVEQALDAMTSMNIQGEVLVADNGSTDGSQQLAEEFGARVIPIAERGYGNAVRGGIDAASYPYIVLGDADGQHDFSEIPKFILLLEEGYELVVGDRFNSLAEAGSMSWTHRYLGNPMLSGLVRLLHHTPIHDSQCGMRAMTREAFLSMNLRSPGFELCPEMVIRAAHHHLKAANVPIRVLPEKRDRKPHLRTIPDGWRHLIFIMMSAPNVLFDTPGAAFLLLGVAITSYLAAGPRRLFNVGLNTRFEVLGILMASFGLQLLSLGVFCIVFTYRDSPRMAASTLAKLRHLKLETGLIFGGGLVLVGVVADAIYLWPWLVGHTSSIQHVSQIFFFLLWLVLGMQMIFSMIFLAMIGSSRRIWIGRDQ